MNNFGSIEITLPMPTLTATMRSRMGFAVQHLLAAASFSRQCGAVETSHSGEDLDYFFDEIKYCCTASVLFSVASLEAHINELFFERSSVFTGHNERLVQKVIDCLDKASILNKYEMALVLRNADEFDHEKDAIYKNVSTLIKLRNALVHFKPEWEDEQKNHKKIGESLKGKFEMSPFIDKYAPIFPKKFLSYGCSRWSVSTTVDFIAKFHEKADIPNKYELFKQGLSTEVI